MIRIAHILGDWSRNIGNAFFQLGGQWVLQQVLPASQIMLIGEQLGYPSYWNPKGGNPKNSYDLAANIDVDYLVLMGPMFRPETSKIWEDSLLKITAKGTRIVLLGIGNMKYQQDYMDQYKRFLKKVKPYIFTSRDSDTFNNLGEFATHAFDGIDFGFFMSDVYKPVGLFQSEKKLLALNFDKIPEPKITIGQPNHSTSHQNSLLDRQFSFENQNWQIRFPKLRTWLSEKSRYTMFLEGLVFPGSNIKVIGGYEVIRPEHRPHPMLSKKTFRYPNVVVNDTPYIYAEIYNQANLTLSTRVHACVLSLIYGNSAMLYSKTPRVRLLSRIGVQDITQKPVKLDLEYLSQEKKKLLSFLEDKLK